jgi:hypothetical protein
LEKNNIKHRLSVPYYHSSNGRIERANRTIRTALKKTKGSTRIKLKKVIDVYNKSYHRAIGMSPNEACMVENKEKVINTYKNYAKEFRSQKKQNEKLKIGDVVLIKNELKANKMQDEFEMKGKIEKNVYGDVYLVFTKEGKTIQRHISQLRRFCEGDVDVSDLSFDKIRRLNDRP